MAKCTNNTRHPIVIVDGHNLLWRATYGFPARIMSRDGTDRTGVFGFFALLRAAAKHVTRPAEWVVCFDGQYGAAARVQESGDYKAGRPSGAIDANPIVALPHVKAGLDEIQIPWIELEDQEADDVIATLAGREKHREVYVMSTDKDYYQLVNASIRILNTALKTEARILGEDDILSRYGVAPSQWCDFRALTGDPADNISGVPGVGKVTAADLLSDGAAIDDLERLGRIKGRIGHLIKDRWADLLKNRELIRFRIVSGLPRSKKGKPKLTWPGAAEVLKTLDLW